MNANEREQLEKLFERVVGAVYEVANVLGAGYLEKVYERASLRELSLRGLGARSQAPFSVHYKGQRIGEYFADILVEDKLVVELKCVDVLSSDHLAQCINYLRSSGLNLALLVNFQKPKVEWKRVVLGL
jgi:GxxExxY protein